MDPNAQQPAQPTPASIAQPATTPVVPPQQPTAAQPATAPATPQQAKKSNIWIPILIIIVLLALVFGGWYYYQNFMGKQANSMYKPTNTTTSITPTTVPSPTVGAVKSGDSQIDQQSGTIDTNMDKLNTDVTNVDKSINDQSGNLN